MVWPGIAKAESAFDALISSTTYNSGSCWRYTGVVALTEKARDLGEESRSPGRAPIYTASGRSGHDNIRARSEVGRAYVMRIQCAIHTANICFACEEDALVNQTNASTKNLSRFRRVVIESRRHVNLLKKLTPWGLHRC